MNIHQEINASLQKINNHWYRAQQSLQGISRLDKDILISDLRQLYDLVFELETVPTKANKFQSADQANLRPTEDESLPKPDKIAESKPTGYAPFESKSILAENTLNQDTSGIEPVKVTLEITKEAEAPRGETQVPEDETNDKYFVDNEKPKQNSPHLKHQKSTSDKFQASKTLADIYHKKTDNSIAARMQKNKITDIKTAIDINDKFLFINEIFKGNTDRYNQTIETINNFSQYHEAIEFVEQIKTESKNDNPAAMGIFIELIKRKFQ